jgi:hypothetical protein
MALTGREPARARTPAASGPSHLAVCLGLHSYLITLLMEPPQLASASTTTSLTH